MDNELLVKSIRELCKNRNIAISQLESDLNFGSGLISRWIKNSPSLDKIVDIADYFHVSIDEVVGRKSNTNDEFLNKLYEQTTNGSITWENCKAMNQHGSMVKEYTDFWEPGTYIGEDEKETSYAIRFGSGYIIMYAYHRYSEMLNPFNLILFIQPTNESFLVDQHYTKEELYSLWIKILNNLGDGTPDEIKAEDLKQQLISGQESLFINNAMQYIENVPQNEDDINKLLSDEKAREVLIGANTPEIQQLITMFTNPKMKQAMESAGKMIQYFSEIKDAKDNIDK